MQCWRSNIRGLYMSSLTLSLPKFTEQPTRHRSLCSSRPTPASQLMKVANFRANFWLCHHMRATEMSASMIKIQLNSGQAELRCPTLAALLESPASLAWRLAAAASGETSPPPPPRDCREHIHESQEKAAIPVATKQQASITSARGCFEARQGCRV